MGPAQFHFARVGPGELRPRGGEARIRAHDRSAGTLRRAGAGGRRQARGVRGVARRIRGGLGTTSASLADALCPTLPGRAPRSSNPGFTSSDSNRDHTRERQAPPRLRRRRTGRRPRHRQPPALSEALPAYAHPCAGSATRGTHRRRRVIARLSTACRQCGPEASTCVTVGAYFSTTIFRACSPSRVTSRTTYTPDATRRPRASSPDHMS